MREDARCDKVRLRRLILSRTGGSARAVRFVRRDLLRRVVCATQAIASCTIPRVNLPVGPSEGGSPQDPDVPVYFGPVPDPEAALSLGRITPENQLGDLNQAYNV